MYTKQASNTEVTLTLICQLMHWRESIQLPWMMATIIYWGTAVRIPGLPSNIQPSLKLVFSPFSNLRKALGVKHRDSLKIVNCMSKRRQKVLFGITTCSQSLFLLLSWYNKTFLSGKHDRVSSAPSRTVSVSHRIGKSSRMSATISRSSRNRFALVSPSPKRQLDFEHQQQLYFEDGDDIKRHSMDMKDLPMSSNRKQ